MDRLDAIRVFIAVADAKGFSAASRKLRMPLPTVSRKVAELESYLGAQLLNRSTRRVTVTESGQRFYQDARRILDDLGDVERQVSQEYRQPIGRLTITAPALFGRLNLLPIANEFMRRHEQVSIRMVLTNRVVNYLEEHVDLGIRIGPLSDSSMIAARVGQLREFIGASPRYLARHGRPRTPADLSQHECISYSVAGEDASWQFKLPSGQIERIPIRAKAMFSTVEAIVDWAVLDGGVAMMYAYQAADSISESKLEIVLKDYEVDPLPVSFIYPQSRLVPQKVRTFIDFATPLLRDRLIAIEDKCAT